MEWKEWLSQNAFELISTLGLVVTLAFNAFSIRADTKARRNANLLTVTTNHREIWSLTLTLPQLRRIRDPEANLVQEPLTEAERAFVNIVLQHLNSVYRAEDENLMVIIEKLRLDVSQFFSLPVPYAAWQKLKRFQNGDFVEFIEDCLQN